MEVKKSAEGIIDLGRVRFEVGNWREESLDSHGNKREGWKWVVVAGSSI